jgi:hypothetical protein
MKPILAALLFITLSTAQVDTIRRELNLTEERILKPAKPYNGSPYRITIPEIQSEAVFVFYYYGLYCSVTHPADFDLKKLDPVPGVYLWERHEGYRCEILYYVVHPFKYEIISDSGKSYTMEVIGVGQTTQPINTVQVKIYANATTSTLPHGAQESQQGKKAKKYLVNGKQVEGARLFHGKQPVKYFGN